MNLVIFDFCETLIRFQTADRFVDFIIQKGNYRKYQWINFVSRILFRLKVITIINKLFPKFNPSKRLKLFQIRGINTATVHAFAEEYYLQEIMPNLILPVYKLMQQHINQNDYVMIISGGYSPYIKLFTEQHHLKKHFATEIEITPEKISGFFLGKDCLYEQKVILLNKFVRENNISFTKSIAYSDSISDLPLLQWADEAFVISNQHSQTWASTHGFKEIIHD